MRIFARLLIAVLALAVAALGVLAYLQRNWLERQWKLQRLTTAVSYDAALGELTWFDGHPDHQEKVGDLVGAWGRGRDVCDLHPAR